MKPLSEQGCARWIVTLCLLGAIFCARVYSHDYTNLNEYQIDRTNESISTGILQIQTFISEIFKQQHISDKWPDPKMLLLRDDMLHQREETAMGLEYFLAAGFNTQASDQLLAHPLVGRSVAANQVVESTYALINYINAMESQDTFIKEVYANGQATWMYNLVTAQREKMDIYHALFVALPTPPGTTTFTPTNPTSATAKNPAQATTSTPQAVMPVVLYILGGLGLCALITLVFISGKHPATAT